LAVSLIYAYFGRFSEAALFYGKKISDTGSETGYQDAITPPWTVGLNIVSMFLPNIMLLYIWYSYDWIAGVMAIVFFMFSVSMIRIFLPKKDGEYFKGLILKSLNTRYDKFLSSNDDSRAFASKLLIDKLTKL
jgi:hypothetical protein